jgi:ribonuclease HI
MNPTINEIYTDGGVIKSNPSPYGGTWAWCGVDAEGNRVIERGGFVESTNTVQITNNHTEQMAIVRALEEMPDGWSGTLYSDSKVALGRVFRNERTKNLPECVIRRTKVAMARMGQIKTVLLQGHPTKDDLARGWGKKRGLPVSKHNVWCDEECNRQKELFEAKCQGVSAV